MEKKNLLQPRACLLQPLFQPLSQPLLQPLIQVLFQALFQTLCQLLAEGLSQPLARQTLDRNPSVLVTLATWGPVPDLE